jgi:hypothetical protein
MPIIRTKKNNNYSIIANQALQNNELSLKAKGLYAYLMTLPDDWDIYLSEVQSHSKDGKEAHYSAFKELIKNGYLVREKKREKGVITSWDYTLYEISPLWAFPQEVKPLWAFPLVVNPQLLITNKELITNKLNTKGVITKEQPNTKPLITLFTDLYKERYRVNPPNYGLTQKKLKETLGRWSEAKIAGALKAYFADPDPFLAKQSHSIQYFASKIDRWIQQAPVKDPRHNIDEFWDKIEKEKGKL